MLERLKLLENNILDLRDLKSKFSLEDVSSDRTKEWALRYGLLETIQIVIDISCYLVSRDNLGNPATYTECIELLQRFEYLDRGLAEKLNGMIGLRNILVHEYLAVDREKLYHLLEDIGDFEEFAIRIQRFL
jgi:uncharacterized protein YutE (UPF0331/DUF86 family)